MTAPIIGEPLTWSPLALGVLLLLITPIAHIVMSRIIEQRWVNLTDDYPAVLFGDPALAVAAAAGLALADGDIWWTATTGGFLLQTVSAVTYGWWQTRTEIAAGRYTTAQAYSPTKLYHQYVVYPIVGYLAFNSIGPGIANAAENGGLAILCLAGVLFWAATVVEAIRRPRLGHAYWNWATRTVTHAPATTSLKRRNT